MQDKKTDYLQEQRKGERQMKINNNMSARITNKQLLRTENNLTKSMERLSSGLKINHAKDNPAGMAISNKMRAQIDGLDRASSNASDGISALNIADGALNETTSILQRMRELAVQAANDTNGLSERQAIQDEIEELKAEMTRISTDTEYNTMPLLNGSLDQRVYAENATRIKVSDYVDPAHYVVEVTNAATKAEVDAPSAGVDYTSNATINAEGYVSFNGYKVKIEATDTMNEVYEKLRDASELGEMETNLDGTNISFTSAFYGSKYGANVTISDATLANALGFAAAYTTNADGSCTLNATAGTDAVVNYKTSNDTYTDASGNTVNYDSNFKSTATVKTDGNKVTITDKNGFSVGFLVAEDFGADQPNSDGIIDLDVTDIGTMTLHIGSNMDQNIEVRIPDLSAESLYVDEVNVTTVTGAGRAITTLDEAIAELSAARSKIGAYTNRLEYSVSSVDAFEENMTSALSRLTDVDMAEEMSTYTQQNVLEQAAISVLTQANDLPQQVLQLLS